VSLSKHSLGYDLFLVQEVKISSKEEE